MNIKSINFIKEHWQLLYHPSVDAFEVFIRPSILHSVRLIMKQLDHDDWRTIGEIAEGAGLERNTVAQITTALKDQLFEKFPCPDQPRAAKQRYGCSKPNQTLKKGSGKENRVENPETILPDVFCTIDVTISRELFYVRKANAVAL